MFSANHLLGVIRDHDDGDKEPKFSFSGLAAATVKKKSQKQTGYQKMANRNRFGSMGLTKEFAQASMKFVMKNPAEDGGCRLGHGFDEEIEDDGGVKSNSEYVPLTGKP